MSKNWNKMIIFGTRARTKSFSTRMAGPVFLILWLPGIGVAQQLVQNVESRPAKRRRQSGFLHNLFSWMRWSRTERPEVRSAAWEPNTSCSRKREFRKYFLHQP